ncbi:MAG: transcriptional repressor [Anaerolineales bacterium]|nr:transcriptional repressor [Anaerolineales bacterium]
MVDNPWLEQLQAAGYRITAARRAVTEVMQSSERALTPIEVYDAARKRDRRLGLVTVYRTLEKLEALGLIQRVHHEHSCQAFLRAGEGHQHLLLCERCRRAILFEGDDLDALFERVGEETGFEIRSHWLQLYGLCWDCQTDS